MAGGNERPNREELNSIDFSDGLSDDEIGTLGKLCKYLHDNPEEKMKIHAELILSGFKRKLKEEQLKGGLGEKAEVNIAQIINKIENNDAFFAKNK